MPFCLKSITLGTLLTFCLAAPGWAQQTELVTPAAVRAELLHGSASALDHRASPQDKRPPADRWMALDKAKHFAVSFLWTVGTQYTLEDKFNTSERQALPFSIGSAAAAGAVKEFYDWHYGPTQYFSRRDLVADAAGILVAAGFIWL